MFVQMGHNYNGRKLAVYTSDLEKYIIENAGAYYQRKSREWMDNDSMPIYLEKVTSSTPPFSLLIFFFFLLSFSLILRNLPSTTISPSSSRDCRRPTERRRLVELTTLNSASNRYLSPSLSLWIARYAYL